MYTFWKHCKTFPNAATAQFEFYDYSIEQNYGERRNDAFGSGTFSPLAASI